MEKSNKLNVLKYMLLYKMFNKKTPIHVGFRITNRCNLKCKYCAIVKRKMKELSTQEIISIINELAEAGTQSISYQGGEALMRDDIKNIVNHTKKMSIDTTIISNGLLIPKKIDILKNLDCVVLSLDGNKKSHEKNRGLGSFDGLMNGISMISKMEIPLITITVLNKYNLGDIDFILEIANKFGFKCTFCPMQPISGYYDGLPSRNEYKKAIDKLIEKKKSGEPIINSIKTLNYLKNWDDLKNIVYFKNHKELIKKIISHKKDGRDIPASFEHLKSELTKNRNFDKNLKIKCMAGKLFCTIDTDGVVSHCDISKYFTDSCNATEMGVKKSFQNLSETSCLGCNCSTYLEYNNIFSFDIPTMLELINF